MIAFGVTFVYPAIIPWFVKAHPEAMPAVHEMQVRVGRLIITPFATLALLTGIYLAADRDLFSETWVTVPMVILIVLLGLGGAFFTPREKELATIARRDLDAGGGLSDEYAAKAQSVGMVGALSSAAHPHRDLLHGREAVRVGGERRRIEASRSPLSGLEMHRSHAERARSASRPRPGAPARPGGR